MQMLYIIIDRVLAQVQVILIVLDTVGLSLLILLLECIVSLTSAKPLVSPI